MKKFSKLIKTNTGLLITIAILALILIVLMAIAFWPGAGNDFPEVTAPGTSLPTVAVETPYCVLKYPEQWKDRMAVEESTTDGVLAVMFFAKISEEQFPLYTVYFGESANGEFYGTLPGDGGTVPVYIECHKLADRDDLSESERALFYSMMEGVNEVAQSIAAASGFTKK